MKFQPLDRSKHTMSPNYQIELPLLPTVYRISVDCKQRFYMTSELRKKQLRESQQRRRERLAQGGRSQISIYIDKTNLELMDNWCTQLHVDRNNFINNLITELSTSPDSIYRLINSH